MVCTALNPVLILLVLVLHLIKPGLTQGNEFIRGSHPEPHGFLGVNLLSREGTVFGALGLGGEGCANLLRLDLLRLEVRGMAVAGLWRVLVNVVPENIPH